MRFATTSTSTRQSCRRCSRRRVRESSALVCIGRMMIADEVMVIGNSFTPWFKLIARDFLFGWWDELLARKENGVVNAKSLEGVADGSKVIKMT
jgi:hypothetical protein